jgi:leucyl aminopeptidase (aminopeptidase T)
MLPRGSVVGVGVVILVALTACSGANAPAPPPTPAPAAPAAQPAPEAPRADLAAVAATMVRSALVKPGDKVMVLGNVRDRELLEDLGIEAMKAGGEPLMTFTSDRFDRRSFDEVPASFDSQPQAFATALAGIVDVQLSVIANESETTFAGVPPERLAARNKTAVAVAAAMLKKSPRVVNLGNGIYPTASLAARLGKSLPEIEAVFWKAAAVAPEAIRARAEPLRAAFAGAKQVTLSNASGTTISFAVDGRNGLVSDGALTPEKVKAGRATPQTWLPAGEVLLPVTPGSAEGVVTIDKFLFQGAVIEGLTLRFAKGKLTEMTAKSDLARLRAYYDASSGGKDLFSYIDLGVNPEALFPTDTGAIVWMAPGAVTVGIGDNTGWNGSNVSSFALSAPVSRATLAVDGKVLIENGVLK